MGKILITGTGRCGSSYLVHMLTYMGMDTGFTNEYCREELNNYCRGGCEWGIDNKYRVLKNPMFAVDIKHILENYEIDHVIIPIRDLTKSAQSREANNSNHGGYGGFWLGASSVEQQKESNAKLIYNLVQALTEYDVPFTMLDFPRVVKDKRYLKEKLLSIFKKMSDWRKINNKIDEAFAQIADKDKVTI